MGISPNSIDFLSLKHFPSLLKDSYVLSLRMALVLTTVTYLKTQATMFLRVHIPIRVHYVSETV